MPTESLPPSKECCRCKRLLPASAYCKGDITKYFKCKECENKRLKEYRNKVKAQEKRLETVYPAVICHACKESIPFNKLIKTGKFCNSICKPCNNKIKYHGRAHNAELINGCGPCTRCAFYGKSNSYIRPHKVDLDESD